MHFIYIQRDRQTDRQTETESVCASVRVCLSVSVSLRVRLLSDFFIVFLVLVFCKMEHSSVLSSLSTAQIGSFRFYIILLSYTEFTIENKFNF